LFSNCNGVSHIAAAVKTSSFIISMDGEPERWAPADKNLHHVINWAKEPHFETVFGAVVKMISDKSAREKNSNAQTVA